MFVLHTTFRYQDCTEYGAKIIPTIGAAIEAINKIANSDASCMCTFQLFKLGEEIKLTNSRKIVETKVEKEQLVYSVEGA